MVLTAILSSHLSWPKAKVYHREQGASKSYRAVTKNLIDKDLHFYYDRA